MGVGDNENPIISFKLIVTSLMIFLLIFIISNVASALIYLIEDCKEIISKNNDPNLFIGFILLKYLFHNNNFPHVLIHITDIYLNAIKFFEIIKQIIKEIRLNKYAEMSKLLTKKPFENLDGAGGNDSDEDDYFEEIMCVNKGEKEEYFESRKLKQKIN
ncbi:hypothetical protein ACTFIR_001682 [Dictyostelium discoideum]